MKTRVCVVALSLALAALGGCYWAAPPDNGTAAVTASVPRGVISNPTGFVMRAYLYPAAAASVQYLDASGMIVTDPALYAFADVVASGGSIPLEGHDYWEVQVDLRSPTSGSFTIDGIPAGVRCRLHLQLFDWTKGGTVAAEGLSDAFVAAAGADSAVAVDLYVPAP